MSKKSQLRVLSLFDGIACARVALERAGFSVSKYFSSEIDLYANQVNRRQWPDNIYLGNIKAITKDKVGKIDLMIGGSPCQDLSIAKQNRQGLKGSRSSLFWEYIRLLKEVQPTYFVLENVASMSKADRDTISEVIGVQPIMIDAALVSAQNRKRLFWTNIPDITLPDDKGILLKDILQPDAEVDPRMVVKGKAHVLTATYNGATEKNSVTKRQRTMVRVGHFNKGGQGDRIYSIDGKSVALQANAGGKGAKTGLYIVQTPRGKNKGGIKSMNGKTPTLSCSSWEHNNHLVKGGKVRKLTPIECERLQCLPDNYTRGIPQGERYKCLGNAFNVDVVAHILSFMKI